MICVTGEKRHRTGMADRRGLARVADHRDTRPALGKHLPKGIRAAQIHHPSLVDDDPIAGLQREPLRSEISAAGYLVDLADSETGPALTACGIVIPAESVVCEQRMQARCADADLARGDDCRLLRRREKNHSPALPGERVTRDAEKRRLARSGGTSDRDHATRTGDGGCRGQLCIVKSASISRLPTRYGAHLRFLR